MRIGRLIRYTGVAAISGTIGFLIGGGRLPDTLRGASREITAQARATADEFRRDDTTLTGALNYVRDRLSAGAQRVTGLLDDDGQ
jgi:hypothetical protein